MQAAVVLQRGLPEKGLGAGPQVQLQQAAAAARRRTAAAAAQVRSAGPNVAATIPPPFPPRVIPARLLYTAATAAELMAAPLSARYAGLRNIGNTCYINAALQCAMATTPLIAGLRMLPDGAAVRCGRRVGTSCRASHVSAFFFLFFGTKTAAGKTAGGVCRCPDCKEQGCIDGDCRDVSGMNGVILQ